MGDATTAKAISKPMAAKHPRLGRDSHAQTGGLGQPFYNNQLDAQCITTPAQDVLNVKEYECGAIHLPNTHL
jgi:hypothetical protein